MREWETRTLGSCLLAPPAYGVSAPAIPYAPSLPVYLRITDIAEDGRFRPSARVCVDIAEPARYALREGDLVVARTGATVGKSYLYDPKDGPLVFAGYLVRIRPNPAWLDSRYLAAYMRSSRYWAWARSMCMRSGQPGINGQEYAEMRLPLPPLDEQRAIVETMGDVDALLRATEALWAKKRDLRQATMQALLSGARRLDGFLGEWPLRQVGELGAVDPELLSEHTPPRYRFRYIALEDVECGVLRSHSAQVFGSAPLRARRPLRVGDVLVSTVRPHLGSHFLVSLDEPDWVCSTGYAVVRARADVLWPRYFFYQLFSDAMRRQMDARLTGSSYPAITNGDVGRLRIPVPSLPEQQAIAGVLSDLDDELALLEKRMQKTKALRQAMIEELFG